MALDWIKSSMGVTPIARPTTSTLSTSTLPTTTVSTTSMIDGYCCSSIILTLGNDIKEINSYLDYEGVYTFSGIINGMDYFVHSAKQVAIWYMSYGNNYYWIIGAVSNLGNFGPAKM